MAGNVWEWTTEGCMLDGGSCLVYRGGGYDDSGSVIPAAYRDDNDDVRSKSIAFRVLLYK